MYHKKPKFITYTWLGVDASQCEVTGEIQAVNSRLAKARLQAQKISILKLKRKTKFTWLRGYQKRITSVKITLVLRQLVTLLAAGIPILQAFEVIAKNCNNLKLQNLLITLKEKIQQGHSLSEALQAYPKYFNHLVYALVFAGEQSGTLDLLLMKVVTHREKMQHLKNKIKKALFYPCAVIVVSLMVTYVLLVFVVPQFTELFAGFGAQLPFLTRMIIKLSNFLQRFWWLVLLCLILPIIGVVIMRCRNKIFAKFFDQMVLKIPIIGNILKKSIIARLMQTLATIFASGVPLLKSLRLLQKIANNAQFYAALDEIYTEIDKGQTLHQSLQMSGLFPNIIIQMVAIGEEAGKLSDMLEKAAGFFQEEVDQLVDKLNQLLEPIVMMVLGIIVGGLVIAMYLPIFKLGMVI